MGSLAELLSETHTSNSKFFTFLEAIKIEFGEWSESSAF